MISTPVHVRHIDQPLTGFVVRVILDVEGTGSLTMTAVTFEALFGERPAVGAAYTLTTERAR